MSQGFGLGALGAGEQEFSETDGTSEQHRGLQPTRHRFQWEPTTPLCLRGPDGKVGVFEVRGKLGLQYGMI